MLLQEVWRIPGAGSQGRGSVATYTRAKRQAETRPFGNQPLWERTNLATALRSLFSVFSQPTAQGSGGRAPLLGQPPPSVPALSLLGEEDPEGRARPWRGYPSCGRCPVRARCRSGRSRYGRAGGVLLELLVIIIHYCCSSPPRSWAATEVEAHACVYMTRRHTRCAPAAGRAGAGPPAERPLPPCACTYPPFNFYPSLLLFPPPLFFLLPPRPPFPLVAARRPWRRGCDTRWRFPRRPCRPSGSSAWPRRAAGSASRPCGTRRRARCCSWTSRAGRCAAGARSPGKHRPLPWVRSRWKPSVCGSCALRLGLCPSAPHGAQLCTPFPAAWLSPAASTLGLCTDTDTDLT